MCVDKCGERGGCPEGFRGLVGRASGALGEEFEVWFVVVQRVVVEVLYNGALWRVEDDGLRLFSIGG